MVAFANLAQVYFIDKEVPYPLREYMIENCPNLVGLINRIKVRRRSRRRKNKEKRERESERE